MGKVIQFPSRRASGSWDSDLRTSHNERILRESGIRPQPTCHDDVTWADIGVPAPSEPQSKQVITLIETTDPDGSQEK